MGERAGVRTSASAARGNGEGKELPWLQEPMRETLTEREPKNGKHTRRQGGEGGPAANAHEITPLQRQLTN